MLMSNGQERRYYTPSTRGAAHPEVSAVPKIIEQSRSMSVLTERLAASFGQRETGVVKVYHNGDNPYYPRDREHKTEFDSAVREVVYSRCQDLLDETGKVLPEATKEWDNVLQIAPALSSILLSRQGHIVSVGEEHATNVFGFAIDVARDPSLLGRTVINTGFGGSDSEYTSTRLPAYAIPALTMHEQIVDFYKAREQVVVIKERRSRAYNTEVAQRQESLGRELTREERAEIGKAIADSSYGLPELSAEDIGELRTKNAIITTLPTVRFFFASQAAIAINHTMQPDKVRARTAANLETVKGFVSEHYPHLESSVRYAQDIPWDQRKHSSMVVVEYCAHVLRDSQDPSIQNALTTLQKLGGNRGGEKGRERAAEYAAIHPLVFGDRLDIPVTYHMQGIRSNPDVMITIGGRPEIQFNAIREYLSRNANPEGLLEFIEQRGRRTHDHKKKAELETMAYRVRLWMQQAAKRRERYQNGHDLPTTPRYDLPHTSIRLGGEIGAFPTYYLTEHDAPIGTNVGDQLEDLLAIPNLPSTTPQEKLTKERRRSVIYDINAFNTVISR